MNLVSVQRILHGYLFRPISKISSESFPHSPNFPLSIAICQKHNVCREAAHCVKNHGKEYESRQSVLNYIQTKHTMLCYFHSSYLFRKGPKISREGRGRDLNPGKRLHRPIGYQATSPRPLFGQLRILLAFISVSSDTLSLPVDTHIRSLLPGEP